MMKPTLLLLTITISTLSLIPGSSSSEAAGFSPYVTPNGMVMHVLAYGVWMGVAALAFPDRLWRMALLGLALGAILELIQWPLPYRTFNPVDLAANTVGIGVGMMVWGVGKKVRREASERKKSERRNE